MIIRVSLFFYLTSYIHGTELSRNPVTFIPRHQNVIQLISSVVR